MRARTGWRLTRPGFKNLEADERTKFDFNFVHAIPLGMIIALKCAEAHEYSNSHAFARWVCIAGCDADQSLCQSQRRLDWEVDAMNTECPNLEKCPMFKYFQTDFAKETYISLYCRDRFADCERKKLKDSCREVPATLLPDGQYL
jgi:hypothetical protein